MTVSALNSALSGLKLAQAALDTVSSNISNAGTEGYTRKILPQETFVSVSGEPLGVHTQAIIRNVDNILVRDLVKQVSVSSNRSVLQGYLDRIQDFNGATENAQSVAAKISDLASAFTDLSSAPDSIPNLEKALLAARLTAEKFNDFSDMLIQMRNQTETEILSAVNIINGELETVARLNKKIVDLSGAGLSTATLEDQRDISVRKISEYMQISSFPAENGKMVLTTKQGQTLADENARLLVFNRNSNILPSTYYPGGGLSGLFIGSTSGIELTSANTGGAIGALLQLRDEELPAYGAQIDELAQKLAHRFDQQGLRLFTDADATVPANVADPGLVGYVGFAGRVRVNEDVLNDVTLIREGTNGNGGLPGSNEIIRKVIEFAFGPHAYEEVRGNVNVTLPGGLIATTPLTRVNRVPGNAVVTGALYQPTLGAHPDINPPTATFTINANGFLTNVNITPATTLSSMITSVNASAGFQLMTLNGEGQIVLNAETNITINNTGIGAAGIAALGFSFTTYPAQNPSFSVQVGQQQPVNIVIGTPPTDTVANLLADLNVIPGLTATTGPGGVLVITPTEGGDITVQNILGSPVQQLGLVINNIAHTPFRTQNLGPDGSLETGLVGNAAIEDYARAVMTSMAEDSRSNQTQVDREQSFLQILDKRQKDESGVNIDQEMAEMIRIQSNYAAAAKVVTVSERMLDSLLDAIR